MNSATLSFGNSVDNEEWATLSLGKGVDNE